MVTENRYIALEGGDGSGKTTVSTALSAELRARGHQIIEVREPGGTELGEVVRQLLLDSDHVDPWAEVLLFAAQRAQLAREVVAPALEAGTWVISDRTYYSSIAYQGRARGMGEDRVRRINEIGLDGVVPDHVFVLDVDAETALKRQDRPDRIGKEGVEFQEEVRNAYRGLSQTEPEKVSLISVSAGVDGVVAQIIERLGLV
jgi:dTMP kinase